MQNAPIHDQPLRGCQTALRVAKKKKKKKTRDAQIMAFYGENQPGVISVIPNIAIHSDIIVRPRHRPVLLGAKTGSTHENSNRS